jgi:NAD(P)-dependent dehydrogenase (short-subunit alcohol dehydrogenase family)
MAPSGRLPGKRAIITGAGTGLGRSVALLFAREGARVGLIGRRQEKLREVESLIAADGGKSLVLPCDVSKESQVAAAFAIAEDRWEGVDACIAVAGIELWGAGDGRVDQLELSVWQQTIDVNLTGMFLTLKYAVRSMRKLKGGSIVVMGSPTGLTGFSTGETAYCASKAGCHGLARAVANEVAPLNIRVNIVVPGIIESGTTATVVHERPELVPEYCSLIPMRRLGQPDEVAGITLFLCTEEASYACGGYFIVDGGLVAV